MSQSKELKKWVLIAILVSVSATSIYNYYFLVDKPKLMSRIDQHNAVINGSAESPYRYRVLVPFIVEGFIKVSSSLLPYPQAFLLMYALAETAFITLLLWTLFVYCRFWFTKDQSLMGALFVAGTMDMALRDHAFQPWSLLEPGLFTLGLILIYRKKYLPLTFLIVLAMLNRETAIFIPLAFLFTEINLPKSGEKKQIISPQSILLFLGWVLLAGVTYLGVRWVRGNAPQVLSVQQLWELNTRWHSLYRAVIEVALFIGIFWLFALQGYRHANSYLRKTVWICPFYLLPIVLWGSWHEVRLLMPLYPILIPLGLSYLYYHD